MKTLAAIQVFFVLLLIGCSEEEKFSCDKEAQFTFNGDSFCAGAFVPRHEIEEINQPYEDLTLTMGSNGVDIKITVLTTKEIFQESKAYTNTQMAMPQTPQAWFSSTSIELQTINLISVTFTKLDRTNKTMSGKFTLDATQIVVGKVEPLVGEGSFTDVPYYD
jgi:hypothetical protein